MIIAPLPSRSLLSDRRIHKLAQQKGLFCSSVDPRAWADFEEAAFREALEDWGYFGPPAERPAWLPEVQRE
jgi:hypothetical protein